MPSPAGAPSTWCMACRARDPICGGDFRADLRSLSKEPPATSLFADVREATDFVFELDGSCGYDFATDRLSFQEIEYPEWDISFCHAFEQRFALIEHLDRAFELDLRFDCTLFMQNVRQVWKSARLYAAQGPRRDAAAARASLPAAT